MTDVSLLDDVYVDQSATAEYTIHEFKDFVGTAGNVRVEARARTTVAPSLSTVYLQIYNYNSSTWETIDSDNGSPADTKFTLTADIADLTNYKNGSQMIVCRVYQLGI
jgi:hypothetical protein